mmetsp:Transcript_241/g.478  ORF Transcript_241/g.478 Transcript_241/m.478 type:complete len:366 (+) Transcript_241:32-1129(+)|eukprot:CAMPEP_0204273274 /NCGR_PEP_ID=MMETSP0468-20130131/22969_1 /ASSEMBLY_ACC=CAM_ASM_000383 /TAXON_ID=2969 /ORGANISM="Oxyrrhis marina" /LENGTH=365 /DNA_ID=CAMNT_0051249257 /DNA_START=21 /DNA_END=1118 /DNA_ORIENTATION=-
MAEEFNSFLVSTLKACEARPTSKPAAPPVPKPRPARNAEHDPEDEWRKVVQARKLAERQAQQDAAQLPQTPVVEPVVVAPAEAEPKEPAPEPFFRRIQREREEAEARAREDEAMAQETREKEAEVLERHWVAEFERNRHEASMRRVEHERAEWERVTRERAVMASEDEHGHRWLEWIIAAERDALQASEAERRQIMAARVADYEESMRTEQERMRLEELTKEEDYRTWRASLRAERIAAREAEEEALRQEAALRAAEEEERLAPFRRRQALEAAKEAADRRKSRGADGVLENELRKAEQRQAELRAAQAVAATQPRDPLQAIEEDYQQLLATNRAAARAGKSKWGVLAEPDPVISCVVADPQACP